MSTTRITAALGCLVVSLFLVPPLAEANERYDPVKVTLAGVPKPARAGESFEDIVRIRVAPGVVISEVTLSGPGWSIDRFDTPKGELSGEAVDLSLPFRAVPTRPDAALVLEWTRDGAREYQLIDVSPAAYERARPRRSLALLPGEEPDETALEPSPPDIPGPSAEMRGDRFFELYQSSLDSPAPLAPAVGRTITVTGRLVCKHEMIEGIGVSFCPVGVYGYDNQGHSTLWYPTWGNGDVDGYFSIDFFWPHDTDPNIQLRYAAANEAIIVQEDDIWEDTYTFISPVFPTVTGSALEVGRLEPVTTNEHAAMYIAETLGRARDFIGFEMGVVPSQAECLFPDSDGSSYSSFWVELHIAPEHRWNEGTMLHEYGHHFNSAGFGYKHTPTSDWYCNGICDSGDCSHCIWCEETGKVAWNEGLAQIFSRYWSNGLENWYAKPVVGLNHKGIDTIGYDSRCPSPQDPTITEGFFAAAAWDLIDGMESDHDDPEYGEFKDVLSGWEDEVFDVINTTCAEYGRRPRYPMEFMRCFIAQYPNYRQDIWETLRHNGFDLDEEPPGEIRNIITNPAINTLTPDNTIIIDWDRPIDDASGVGSYATRWNTAPLDPGTYANISDVTRETSIPLAPGTWYFTIRARDRSGKWSDTYTVVGPFLIRSADPVDLEPFAQTGWVYPLVPRDDTSVSTVNGQLSSSLPEWTDTYWSFAVRNDGEAASTATSGAVYLDDEANILDSVSLPSLVGSIGTLKMNKGPITVTGGRHVLGLFLDSDEVNAESDEIDNYWAAAFVWYPRPVSISEVLIHGSPPPVNGGLDYFAYETPYFIPCRGYYLEAWLGFTAIWMYAEENDEVDYDLALYDNDYGVESGFDVPQAISARPPNSLEVLLVNTLVAPYEHRFVGTRNQTLDWNASNADYRIRGLRAQFVGNTYTTYSGSLSADRMLDLYAFAVDPSTGGSLTITLFPESIAPQMHMAYFAPGFGTGALMDADAMVTVAGGDSATIEVPGPFSELAAVAVWRDPGDSPPSLYKTYDIRFEASPPDPAIRSSSKWAAPIVPQPDASIGAPYGIVPAPATLSGTGPTYLYLAEKNSSPATAPQHDITTMLDGDPLVSSNSPASLLGYEQYLFMESSPVTIPGGRHTLGMELDLAGVVHEISEANNRTARQWVWSPSTLPWGSTLPVSVNIDPIGGWESIPGGEDTFFNCSGFRTQTSNHHVDLFTVAFLACNPQVDGDLRIHAPGTGPQDGFQYPVKYSGLSTGKADFVIMNTTATGGVARDLGVVNMNGTGTAYLEVDGSGITEITATGKYSGFVLDGADFVRLHPLRLPTGRNYRFQLQPTGGDLAFSLHDIGDDPYSGRLDASVEADAEGPDGEEEIWETIDNLSTHVLAVWRPKTRDYLDPVGYQIIISKPSVGVGDDLPDPSANLTVAATPNPFGPQTSFHVETTEDAPLRLVIHDMRGAVVRRLDRGQVPAGNHVLNWDGRDAQGRRIAQGVYFARVDSGHSGRVIKVIKIE